MTMTCHIVAAALVTIRYLNLSRYVKVTSEKIPYLIPVFAFETTSKFKSKIFINTRPFFKE